MMVTGCTAESSSTTDASGEVSERPTAVASPTVGAMDLDAVVIPPDARPNGMTLSDEGSGPATLQQLPLFADTAADLLAAPGFVDGRWSRFAGSADDFAASRGFILTWVAQYASSADAASTYSILLNELTSEEHYGWDGEDAHLGDGARAPRGTTRSSVAFMRRFASGGLARLSCSLAAAVRTRRR